LEIQEKEGKKYTYRERDGGGLKIDEHSVDGIEGE
jgi:hypothetical protein